MFDYKNFVFRSDVGLSEKSKDIDDLGKDKLVLRDVFPTREWLVKLPSTINTIEAFNEFVMPRIPDEVIRMFLTMHPFGNVVSNLSIYNTLSSVRIDETIKFEMLMSIDDVSSGTPSLIPGTLVFKHASIHNQMCFTAVLDVKKNRAGRRSFRDEDDATFILQYHPEENRLEVMMVTYANNGQVGFRNHAHFRMSDHYGGFEEFCGRGGETKNG